MSPGIMTPMREREFRSVPRLAHPPCPHPRRREQQPRTGPASWLTSAPCRPRPWPARAPGPDLGRATVRGGADPARVRRRHGHRPLPGLPLRARARGRRGDMGLEGQLGSQIARATPRPPRWWTAPPCTTRPWSPRPDLRHRLSRRDVSPFRAGQVVHAWDFPFSKAWPDPPHLHRSHPRRLAPARRRRGHEFRRRRDGQRSIAARAWYGACRWRPTTRSTSPHC